MYNFYKSVRVQSYWALQYAYLQSVKEVHWDWCQYGKWTIFSMYPRYIDYNENNSAWCAMTVSIQANICLKKNY